jgi:hypothetical protein
MYSLIPLAWVITFFVVTCFVVSIMMGGGVTRPNRLLGVAALLWVLYCGWENFIADNFLDVRVDLLLIAPALLVVTVSGLILWVKGWSRTE